MQMNSAPSPQLSRRAFLRIAALSGLGLAGAGVLLRSMQPPSDAGLAPISDADRFLFEVGGTFFGTTLRIASEATPLSRTIAQMAADEFTPLTGITIAWDQMPLGRLLTTTLDAYGRPNGTYDLYDWDQAWLGSLAADAADLRPLMERSDLALPGYQAADILPQLVHALATDGDRRIGVPFDVPVYVLLYRRDLFEELGLRPPTNLAEYMAAARTLHTARAPIVSGTLGQWGAGLYSLVCDTTAWLWAHGGAIYGADGRSALMDAHATAALEYMLELRGLMPPEALSWDWWDASEALLQGRVGMALFWNALLPALDDPFESKVAGLIEVAPCPVGFAPRNAGFGETPGIGRHGGSLLALANTSRQQEAAWIFMQWASSPAVLERACLISGATPIRRSTYTALQAQPGAPRHLDATFDTITRRLGTEPRLPAWPTLAVDHLAADMGRLLAGEQSVRTTQERMARAAEALA